MLGIAFEFSAVRVRVAARVFLSLSERVRYGFAQNLTYSIVLSMYDRFDSNLNFLLRLLCAQIGHQLSHLTDTFQKNLHIGYMFNISLRG